LCELGKHVFKEKENKELSITSFIQDDKVPTAIKTALRMILY
jgi:hypothetical protein